MSGIRQGWLVARRELRERIRSKGLWAGTAIMLLVVVAVIVVPALVDTGTVTRDVGFAGAVPDDLPGVATDQGDVVDVTVRVRHYDDVDVGEGAVRDKDIDVLVVDARRLQWRGEPDERLRAVLTGAIQLVAVQERAAAAGITPDELAALAAPVPVENEELGIASGRSPDDETAAYVMSILLLAALATYGQLVLTGVAQEKSSRVVEVLLARMPARNLLAGKVAGIGLLGFAQFAVTALAALVATLAVDSVDIPAISGAVLAWVVAWFVLGYVMYAMTYGAFGSLASRVEDASSIAAPATTVLIVGYWASFIAVTSDPEGGWSRFVSLFPATAPFAMPGRIALGATAWWEPLLAVAFTLTAIAGLVVFAGRVYTGAILQGGATLKLRDAWRRGATAPGVVAVDPGPALVELPTARQGGGQTTMSKSTDGTTNAILVGIAVVLGAVVFVVARDFVMALIAGAGLYALASRAVKARRHLAP
jgi:ABC-2 type transport system permease protein